MRMEVELPSREELKLQREISIVDAVNEYVIKGLYNENRVSLSVADVENITARDDISRDDIKLIADSFKENENGKMAVSIYTEGESGEESLEFVARKENN